LTDGARNSVVHAADVRHESLFFTSGSDQLYATLYSPAKARVRLGVVLCQAWGAHGMTMYGWCQRTGRDLAAAGIATIIPHWPGTFDSEGDPQLLTFDRITEAGADTVAAAEQRVDIPAWGVVGVGIGAAAAALLTTTLPASRCVLAQPALDPVAYFAETERRSRRASLGAPPNAGWAFGYPIPPGLRAADTAGRVDAALGSFAGQGAVVRYRKPTTAPSPAGFDTVTIRGHWGRPSRDDRQQLRRRATRWLVRSLGQAA
jgi:hypothetical protein